MKNKEKEKFWFSIIKENGKIQGWGFKGYFIFKQLDTLFFCANFFINPKTNELNANLGYKTLNIDNTFWDIIGEGKNKEMSLSFRGEAAFCVRELNFKDYKIKIDDILNPENNIEELLTKIERDTQEKRKSINSLMDFVSEMTQNEKQHTVGIISGLIELGLTEQAHAKISEYKTKNFSSGFGFENNKDFYDLANEYCEKNCR